jgi:hypothetical protein
MHTDCGLVVCVCSGLTGFQTFDQKEQTDDGTTYRFWCPSGCGEIAKLASETTRQPGVFGSDFYADLSLLCASAIHAGVINDDGGQFEITIEEGRGLFASNRSGTNFGYPSVSRNFIISNALLSWDRSFTVRSYPLELVETYTMAGVPTAPLDTACSFKDTQPPQEALVRVCSRMRVPTSRVGDARVVLLVQFNSPSGIAIYQHANPTDKEFIYVSDAANNRIRTITAVCAKPCENGGVCIGSELCNCTRGWGGSDCTTPVCTGRPEINACVAVLVGARDAAQ